MDPRLAAVASVMHTFAQASREPERLFEMIAHGLADLVGDSCSLLLLDATRTQLEVVARHDRDPDANELGREVSVAPIRLDAHPVPRAVQETGVPFVAVIPPASVRVPHTSPAYAAYAAAVGLHSILIVPLRVQAEVTGQLTLMRHRATPRPYDDADRDLALMLADHAALALANARTYAQLVKSQREHQEFFETSPVAMFVFDLEHYRVLAANGAARELYGYTSDEMVGQPLAKLRASAAPDLEATLARLGTDVQRSTAWHQRRDGSTFFAEGTTHVSTFAGRPARFVIINDITQLADAQRAQRLAETRFRRLADSGMIGIIVADFEDRIHEVNEAVVALLGYSREELTDARFRWSSLASPDWQAAHHATLAQLRADPVALPAEREYVGKDGRRIPVLSGAAVLDDGTRILSCVLDLQGHQWAAAALEHLREARLSEARFQVANRELEAFSYSVAHDLRAPLRAMSGFASLLGEVHAARLDDEGREWVAEIQTNAEKMGALIDALLSLARMSRGDLRAQPTDLAELVRDAVRGLAAAEPGRRFELVVPAVLEVTADPQLARIVVENLVGNAWKYTREQAIARIEVGVELVAGDVAVYVRDNGVGFDMAYAAKLFVPFARLHAARDFPGVGIGLATVQRIVHRHGGRIWADSIPGQGATFHFTMSPGAPA